MLGWVSAEGEAEGRTGFPKSPPLPAMLLRPLFSCHPACFVPSPQLKGATLHLERHRGAPRWADNGRWNSARVSGLKGSHWKRVPRKGCPLLPHHPLRDSSRSGGARAGALCTCWGARPLSASPKRLLGGRPCRRQCACAQVSPARPQREGPRPAARLTGLQGARRTPCMCVHTPAPHGRAHAAAGAQAQAGTCTRAHTAQHSPGEPTPPRGHPRRSPQVHPPAQPGLCGSPSCGEGVPAKAVWASPGGGSRRALGSASPLKHPPAGRRM